MKKIDIVQRIEGEAKLKLTWKDGVIEYGQIAFLNSRGFEKLLEQKPILDALVLTPRVCGICGQAHLMATVRAIENLYKNIGYELQISAKAQAIRQIALNLEIISSHIKWFYAFILPDIEALNGDVKNQLLLNEKTQIGIKYASLALKPLAIFAGQWPHSSFMIPGGVVCDPTKYELALAMDYVDMLLGFTQEKLLGASYESFNTSTLSGDYGYFRQLAKLYDLDCIGHSHPRFLSLGLEPFDKDKITTSTLLYDYSKASTVRYENEFVQTGPIARMLYRDEPNIKALYYEQQDSVTTRVSARILEIGYLLHETKELLQSIKISEPSYIKPTFDLDKVDFATGYSAVEASRGSLFHEIKVSAAKITTYKMITPTAWNLGPGDRKNLSTLQQAIIGLDSLEKALIVLRSFDVCAVCTTH